jgi:general stress protein 26
MDMKTTSAQIEKVRDLLKDFSTAMLITHDTGGTLHARPMVVADITEVCDLWFITNDKSDKVYEIDRNTRVHVVCQRDTSVYLSIAGTASVIHDRSRIEALWKEPFRVWFPDGTADRHLALIHVTPDRAEYWDSQGLNKVSYLWEAAIAYVSGETPRVKEGERHGVVSLA